MVTEVWCISDSDLIVSGRLLAAIQSLQECPSNCRQWFPGIWNVLAAMYAVSRLPVLIHVNMSRA